MDHSMMSENIWIHKVKAKTASLQLSLGIGPLGLGS